MKTFLCFNILFSITLAFASGKEPLYPYKAGQQYGYCTISQKMVIPAIYRDVESNDHFYLCYDSLDVTSVFNSGGQLIDGAHDVYFVGTSRVLIVKLNGNVTWKGQQKYKYFRRYAEWVDFPPSKAWTIDTNGHKAFIDDTVIAVSNEHLWLRLRNGNKKGVYDVAKNTFVVPMTADSIETVTRKFFVVKGPGHYNVYTLDGKIYRVPASVPSVGNIYNDGGYFETQIMPGQRKAIYDSNGLLVMPAEKYWEPLFNEEKRIIGFYVSNNKMPDKRFAPFELYNGRGEFIKDIYYLERGTAMGNCQVISIYDSTNRNAPLKYLYDMVKNTWQLIDVKPAPNKRRSPWEHVKSEGQFITVNDAGSMFYYSAYTGEFIFSIPDSVWSKRLNKQVFGFIGSQRKTSGLSTYFYRENLDSPLTLVDPVNNTVNKDYDSIIIIEHYLPKYYMVKKGSKWGIMNNSFKELVPALYDKIELTRPLRYVYDNNALDFSFPYLHVTKNGASYWIDTNGKTLFRGIDYQYVTNYSVNGQWLVYSYKQLSPKWDKNYKYTVTDHVSLIDSAGKITTTWKGDDSIGYNYMLTVNGKILRFCGGEKATKPNIQLFDPKTRKVDTLHAIFKEVRTFHNAALLIICEDTGRRLGVYSALNLTQVLPFGHYDNRDDAIRTTEINNTMPGKENGLMLELTEKDDDPGPEDSHPNLTRALRRYGGFYSISGIKFWNKESER